MRVLEGNKTIIKYAKANDIQSEIQKPVSHVYRRQVISRQAGEAKRKEGGTERRPPGSGKRGARCGQPNTAESSREDPPTIAPSKHRRKMILGGMLQDIQP